MVRSLLLLANIGSSGSIFGSGKSHTPSYLFTMCVVVAGGLTGRCRYLIHEELAKHPGSRVYLVSPPIGVLINKDHTHLIPPRITEASHIFVPLSDGGDVERPSTHWSLLVVSCRDRRAFYYDSYCSMLAWRGREASQVIGGWLGFKLDFVDLKDTPQQTDGSSCGVFVCWAMKHLLVRRLLEVEDDKSVDMSLAGKEMDLVLVRDEMRRLVLNLRIMACERLSPSATGFSACTFGNTALIPPLQYTNRHRSCGYSVGPRRVALVSPNLWICVSGWANRDTWHAGTDWNFFIYIYIFRRISIRRIYSKRPPFHPRRRVHGPGH